MKNQLPENDKEKISRGVRRIPEQSLLYERLVPLALIGMTALLLIIVLAALGFLFGFIQL